MKRQKKKVLEGLLNFIGHEKFGTLPMALKKKFNHCFSAWNLLQTELKCCGIQTADDWHEDASSLIRWSTSNALPGIKAGCHLCSYWKTFYEMELPAWAFIECGI
jgi:hypothetical protein